jgi:hypothetical protein
MARGTHITAARGLARHAVNQGAKIVSATTIHWPVYGKCTNPKLVTIHGNPAGDRWIDDDAWGDPIVSRSKRRTHLPGSVAINAATGRLRLRGNPMWVDIEVRCRKCPQCLRARSYEWTQRAKLEYVQSQRTWFGTMTLTPHEHNQAVNRCRQLLARQGVDYDCLPPGEQFGHHVAAVTREVTLWLKRIRKESGAKLRYILVAEAHKSGFPHFHCLVHEQSGSTVTHRQLSSQWKLGFTNFKLVHSPVAASYVCKYLSKSAQARVRASVRYGKTSSDIGTVSAREISPTKSKSIF